MEDKEVQMALYGVSIAIVTHYEDILLAMKLGKQTEAENTIKKDDSTYAQFYPQPMDKNLKKYISFSM